MHDSKRVCLKKSSYPRVEQFRNDTSDDSARLPTRKYHEVASAPRFRHALRQAWARARAHTSHTGCVCALRSLGHGCVQEVKKRYKYCSFSHTNRSFRVLGPSMCSYDGELFNLNFSVHVLFPSYRDSDLYLPLYDWQTRMVWPKNIKIGSTEEKKTPTSWMPFGVSW